MRHALLTASLLLTACAASPDDYSPPDDQRDVQQSGGKADGTESCTISGLQGLYDTFGYKKLDDGSRVPWYRAAMQWHLDAPLTLDDGDEVKVTMYLLPDNRVVIDYAELKPNDPAQLEKKTLAIAVTTISEGPDGTFKLAGLGTATPIEVSENGHCRPTLDLTYEHDILNPGLKGDGSLIVAGDTTGWVADPDHLDQIPSDDGRDYYKASIADGTIKVVRLQ